MTVTAGQGTMTGAESVLRTLAASGVRVCFANPGTSEMHLVAALDRVGEVRAVPALFEGVASGAADGYGRMTGGPAATLLHLGPGLGNAFANLHNAYKARTPLVNLVGDHARAHLPLGAPLATDIASVARPVSHWFRSTSSARSAATDAAAAVAAARGRGGGIATLVLPADAGWEPSPGPAPPVAPAPSAPAARRRRRGGRARPARRQARPPSCWAATPRGRTACAPRRGWPPPPAPACCTTPSRRGSRAGRGARGRSRCPT